MAKDFQGQGSSQRWFRSGTWSLNGKVFRTTFADGSVMKEAIVNTVGHRVLAFAVAAIAFLLFIYWEPEAFRGVVSSVVRLAVLALGLAFAYQSFDAFRSALTGQEPKVSASTGNPTSASSRVGGIMWGFIAAGVAFVAVTWGFGLWGDFSR
ncbi:hypothetical protein ACWGTO_33305 [Mesorhizobium sp. PL10]